MKRFFAKEINENQAFLSEEELHHCLHVLRVQEKELVEITDGNGHLWTALPLIISKKTVVFQLQDLLTITTENPAICTLAVALTKNIDRIEWLLEKATEIGLKAFYPIITQRTERKKVRMDRLEKILIAATKQSERLWIPELHEPMELDDFLEVTNDRYKFIAHCVDTDNKKDLTDLLPDRKPATILIGPEGDFTALEIDKALDKGYLPVSLGSFRLRVETAALAACVWINWR